VKPFDRMHPIRGYFNDPRISGSSRAFHFGIDVCAKDGTPVYAVESGTVHYEGGRSLAVVGDLVARTFGYWHVVPAVKHRQRVARGQLLGRVEATWGHVHFAETIAREYVNPVRPGALAPWRDSSSPRIVAIELLRNGKPLPVLEVSGAVDVVVEAWDRPPLAPPAPFDAAIVTPALLRWRVLRGAKVVRPWHTPIDFRNGLLPANRFASVYGPGTRQNKPGKPGRYRFFLAHTWSTRTLPNGQYMLEVAAVDMSGNRAHAKLPFEVVNRLR
jgi:Peptidase family M23